MNNTIVIADAILSNLMSKYKLVRKNPSREYFIADYNIGIIREHIDGIMTRKGSGVIFGVVQDRNGVIIPENDLDSYIYDIILILLIKTEDKSDLLFRYLDNINLDYDIIESILSSLLNMDTLALKPEMEELFNKSDIFIEDVTFNKDNRDEITILGIKFL